MALNLDSLQAPEIVENISFQDIFNELRADFQQRFPDFSALVESDPAIKLLEVAAYREVILRSRINDAFKATLLAFAAAGDLDNLAAFYGLSRIGQEGDEELRARTVNRIQGSSTAGGAAWYRYQALTANTGVRDARVTSPAAGEVQIALLSKEVENIEALGTSANTLSAEMSALATFYGIAILDNDKDAQLAPQIRAAIDSAGPDGTATPQMLGAVDAVMQDSEVRVITDTVLTTSANVVSVDVEVDVYLYPDSSASILNNIEAALRAGVANEGGLGWDLTLSWLIKNIHVDGVQRVELITPTISQVADDGTAISIGTFTLINRGYDR
jgi:phage-related baseplate assembly protein